jgi:type I restriction enzyme M protein
MNLFLHGIEDFQIVRGDTLRNPAFFDGDRLATFDCVIANPPFSLEKWGEDCGSTTPSAATLPACRPSAAATSPGCSTWSSRWPRSRPDAWPWCCRRARCSAKGPKGSIRQKLLEMDLVEAVIGLAPNLFYGTGLAACILVLRKKKPAQRRKKVMIADASRLFRRGRAQNYLEPEHALEIQGWFEKFEDVQDAVRVVGIDDIKAEDWTLNISALRAAPAAGRYPAAAGGHCRLQECTDPLPRGRLRIN